MHYYQRTHTHAGVWPHTPTRVSCSYEQLRTDMHCHTYAQKLMVLQCIRLRLSRHIHHNSLTNDHVKMSIHITINECIDFVLFWRKSNVNRIPSTEISLRWRYNYELRVFVQVQCYSTRTESNVFHFVFSFTFALFSCSFINLNVVPLIQNARDSKENKRNRPKDIWVKSVSETDNRQYMCWLASGTPFYAIFFFFK